MSTPPPPSSNGQWPALGDSEAAAGVCAAAFLVMALLSIMNKRLTGYRLYLIGGGLAGTFRGVSMAIKAATLRRPWVIAGLFPPIIVFGPILGLTAGLVQWTETPPSEHAVEVAQKLRETSATGMLIIASLSSLVVMLCLATSVRARGGFSLRQHASHTIVFLVPGTLMLVWAAVFRVQAVWVRPWTTYDEALLYPLQSLPELLQLVLWCVPTLMARVHLSDRFQPWWKEGHPEGPEAPPLGGFATEPQTPGSLDAEPSGGVQATLHAAGGGTGDGLAKPGKLAEVV